MANTSRTDFQGIIPLEVGADRSRLSLAQLNNITMVGLRFRGRLTIGVANATAVLNGGSILAAYNDVGITEQGADTIKSDALALGAFSEAMNSDTSKVTLQAVAIGSYDLDETIFLPIALLKSISPIETSYRQTAFRDGAQLDVFVELPSLDGNGRIVVPGAGGTATWSNMSVEVVQTVDRSPDVLPVFIPRVKRFTKIVSGADADFEMPINVTGFLRTLLIQQWANGVGEVNDVVNSLAIENDQTNFLGPKKIPFSTQQIISDRSNIMFIGPRGGRAAAAPWVSPGGVYLLHDFAENARLSNSLNPLSGSNLKLRMDVQPSVTPGATSSIVRVTALQLIQVASVTRPPVGFGV